MVGRYGGEEFIIIGPISDHKSAYYLAERLRESVEASLFKCEKNRFKVTISAGVAIWNSSIKDWKQLVKHADTALYAAKNAGRNRVVMEGD
ncbi:MAG TPA: GGDEF domain-containing protein [bacterium]|nr:GGDEF domain-containing protein [bacterium]